MRIRQPLVTHVTLLLLLLCLYAPTLSYLINGWWSYGEHSFGFLIIPISVYLAWRKKEAIERQPFVPSPWQGIPVLGVGVIALVLGRVGGIVRLEALSLMPVIWGVILLVYGSKVARILIGPVAYLIFMFPVFDEAIAAANWHLQLLTAKMAASLLVALGIPATRSLTQIALPSIVLNVAAACSGARYLLSIIALGIPVSCVRLHRWWLRASLIVMAVAIGIMANWLRVALIGVWAYWGGQDVHGPLHVFQGVFAALFGYGALFFGAWGLSNLENGESHKDRVQFCTALITQPIEAPHPSRWFWFWGVACVSLLSLTLYMNFLPSRPTGLKRPLSLLPASMDVWEELRAGMESPLLRIDGADHEVLRLYQNTRGVRLQLYIAYLESQRQGKEVVSDPLMRFHRDARVVSVTLADRPPVLVNSTGWSEESRDCRVFFWYDLNGQIIGNPIKAKLITAWDGITRRRTNGALIMIQGWTSKDVSPQILSDALRDFSRALIPILHNLLP